MATALAELSYPVPTNGDRNTHGQAINVLLTLALPNVPGAITSCATILILSSTKYTQTQTPQALRYDCRWPPLNRVIANPLKIRYDFPILINLSIDNPVPKTTAPRGGFSQLAKRILQSSLTNGKPPFSLKTHRLSRDGFFTITAFSW